MKKISLLRAFEHSEYAPLLVPMKSAGDLLHANTVQVLDGSLAAVSPHFREGNLLVSSHALGIIAILDPAQEKIVWALSGQWRAQHRPRLLPTGRILMFDNFGTMRVGQSRALEVDPFTQEIAVALRRGGGAGVLFDVRRLHPAPSQRQHAHHVVQRGPRARGHGGQRRSSGSTETLFARARRTSSSPPSSRWSGCRRT